MTKNWPEDSKHYAPVPTWWDKHPDRIPEDFADGFGDPPKGTGETIETDDSWMEGAEIW